MTREEIQEWKDKIDEMSQVGMARLWRFAPPGHPVFSHQNQELGDYFDEKFGGMTPAISKAIGRGD